MNQNQALLISDLLNARGFVIDEDINGIPVSYTEFASWIIENEHLLHNAGYKGGKLRSWSSGFRGRGCSYGVTDLDKKITDECIDAYCLLTETIVDSCVTIGELKKYKLAISYKCSCGHKSLIDIDKLEPYFDSKKLLNVKGVCTVCSMQSITPEELSKPWI